MVSTNKRTIRDKPCLEAILIKLFAEETFVGVLGRICSQVTLSDGGAEVKALRKTLSGGGGVGSWNEEQDRIPETTRKNIFWFCVSASKCTELTFTLWTLFVGYFGGLAVTYSCLF